MINDYLMYSKTFLGKRVKLIEPMNDPFPIEVGSEGVVYNVGFDVINVKWDNGRNIGIIVDMDRYEIIDNINE